MMILRLVCLESIIIMPVIMSHTQAEVRVLSARTRRERLGRVGHLGKIPSWLSSSGPRAGIGLSRHEPDPCR
jgi:hypothetical protein